MHVVSSTVGKYKLQGLLSSLFCNDQITRTLCDVCLSSYAHSSTVHANTILYKRMDKIWLEFGLWCILGLRLRVWWQQFSQQRKTRLSHSVVLWR